MLAAASALGPQSLFLYLGHAAGAARCCLLLALLQPHVRPLFPQPLSPAGAPSSLGASQPPRCPAGGSRLSLPQELSTARGGWAVGAGRQAGTGTVRRPGAERAAAGPCCDFGRWFLSQSSVPPPALGPAAAPGWVCFHLRQGALPALPTAAQDGKLAGGEEGELAVGRPRDPLPARPWTPSTAPAAGVQDLAPSPPLPSFAPLRTLLQLPSPSHPIREI